MNKIIVLFLTFWCSSLFSQEFLTPAQKVNFSAVSTYDQISEYIMLLDKSSGLMEVEIFGKSVQNRNLYALKYSNPASGNASSKIKVLIFAQQHGNEQSGKEGALLLAASLLKPENRYLFDRLDIVLIPQMNPDGSVENKRRNGNNMDLNRNHLILTEPETQALHKLFDQYLFEVSMDVHEYWPFGETGIEFGYHSNSDILTGVNTNPNVSEKIRSLSNLEYMPFIKRYLDEQNISNSVYSPGGPPEIDYIRHSTFDINDGRQSLGIQNTFSFIQEGLNGKDSFIENLEHRAKSQMAGMLGLLEYSYQNKEKIRKLVRAERRILLKPEADTPVSIQNEHIKNGEKLKLPVYSYYSGLDSVIIVTDYRPVVTSIFDVDKPIGYLIPKSNSELIEWCGHHSLKKNSYKPSKSHQTEQYTINSIDSIDFERDIIVNPIVENKVLTSEVLIADYVFVPTSQLKGNMIVLALEPKSMLGLVTYPKFEDLLKNGETYNVLRIVKKKHKN